MDQQDAAAAIGHWPATSSSSSATAATPPSALESIQSVGNDEDFRVPFYCEENVWRLGQKFKLKSPTDSFVVLFISNPSKSVLMFHQKASKDRQNVNYIIWDYHVILLGNKKDDEKWSVYDVDTCLTYPCELNEYLQHSFGNQNELPDKYAPFFRIIPLESYHDNFSSDRSHMIDPKTGMYHAPPPSYAPILPRPSNFQRYIDFSKIPAQGPPIYGEIVTLNELRQRFGGSGRR